jgi:hypothetical protein
MQSHRRSDIHGGRRLADATLLIRDGQHAPPAWSRKHLTGSTQDTQRRGGLRRDGRLVVVAVVQVGQCGFT